MNLNWFFLVLESSFSPAGKNTNALEFDRWTVSPGLYLRRQLIHFEKKLKPNHRSAHLWLKLPWRPGSLSLRRWVYIGREPRRTPRSAVQRRKAVLVEVTLADRAPNQTFRRPWLVEEMQAWSEFSDICFTGTPESNKGQEEHNQGAATWHVGIWTRNCSRAWSTQAWFLLQAHVTESRSSLKTSFMCVLFNLEVTRSQSGGKF